MRKWSFRGGSQIIFFCSKCPTCRAAVLREGLVHVVFLILHMYCALALCGRQERCFGVIACTVASQQKGYWVQSPFRACVPA